LSSLVDKNKSNGNIFYTHFIETIFYLNDYRSHGTYNQFPQSERERSLFSLKGNENKEYVCFSCWISLLLLSLFLPIKETNNMKEKKIIRKERDTNSLSLFLSLSLLQNKYSQHNIKFEWYKKHFKQRYIEFVQSLFCENFYIVCNCLCCEERVCVCVCLFEFDNSILNRFFWKLKIMISIMNENKKKNDDVSFLIE
jgi:hypothetical protein